MPALLIALAGAAAIIAVTCLLHNSSPGEASSTARATPQAGSLAFQSLARAASPAPTAASPQSHLEFVWPGDGYVSQGMTPKHPTGIDIAVPAGSEVRAVRDGVVFFVGGDPCCSYGDYIVIAHDGGWSSVYGHLSKFLVKVGDQVLQGRVIGLSGQTGHAVGPHVHFELRSSGRPVNPLDYLRPTRYVQERGTEIAQVAAEAPPAAQQTTEPRPDEATSLAIGWMTQNAQYAYAIDASSCHAIQYGINWLVTCRGTLQGCAGAACDRYLSACVLGQPRLIALYCP